MTSNVTPVVDDPVPREVAAILRRLSLLPVQDQLLAFLIIADYLAASRPGFEPDPELTKRAQALAAMRRAADHLGLPDPSRITTSAFDGTPESVRQGWRSGQVIEVYGKWRFAQRDLRGDPIPETSRQRAVRAQARAMALRTDGYIGSVATWLSTDPPMREEPYYNGWTREERETGRDRGFPHPRASTIRKAYGLPWKVIVRVASGELPLAEAVRRKAERRLAICDGDHDLVSTNDIVLMSGRCEGTVQFWMHRGDFAVPVVEKKRRRAYLRSDVQAFLDHEPMPTRARGCLNSLYIDRYEAAAIAHLTFRSFDMTPDRPPRIAYVGGINLWLRGDIEAWAEGRTATRRLGGGP